MSNTASKASFANLWELLEITEPKTKKLCQEMADSTKELFLQTIKVDGERRYEVRLPWPKDDLSLPDNLL